MEKETKNWWVIHVETEVTFENGEVKNDSRLTSDFSTEEKVLKIICLYAGLTCANVLGEEIALLSEDQMRRKFLQLIKDQKQADLWLDRDEGYLCLNFGVSYYGQLCVKIHCLDFDGTRNFAKEIAVVKNVSKHLVCQ